MKSPMAPYRCAHLEQCGLDTVCNCALHGEVDLEGCFRCPDNTQDSTRWVEDLISSLEDVATSKEPREPGEPDEPSFEEMWGNLKEAAVEWSEAGFELVDQGTFRRRATICDSCEHWKPKARFGLGKCLKCGCTKLKWQLKGMKCPIGKW